MTVLVEWRDEFSLGIPSVDLEHRELIELINELYLRHQEKSLKVTVLDFLGELFARISSHFALEERIMHDRQYDQYVQHKAEHERLLDEIRDFMDDYETTETFEEALLGRFLEFWFTEHFRTHDARLHRHLG